MNYPLNIVNPITLRIASEFGYRATVKIKKNVNTNNRPLLKLGRFDCINNKILQPLGI